MICVKSEATLELQINKFLKAIKDAEGEFE